MFTKLLFRPKFAISFKDMKKSFFEFLNLEAGAVYRGAPEFRERKYLNIEISQKFKELEAKRKQQHLMYAEKRKKLLQQKLSLEAKLLTEYEQSQLTKLDSQIKSLKSVIQEQSKELAEIEKNLQETQAEYILIEGHMKLVVLNSITYLRHVNSVPSGVVLTPQAIKVVENVHYLVTHNLPVPRFKLYELIPDLFTKEIGELDQSVRKLIEEKNLNMFEETTSFPIRQFSRRDKKIRDPIDKQLVALKQQRSNMMINVSMHADRLIKKNEPYIQKVKRGQTPFRNILHCMTCLMSAKLNLKLTEEQQNFKDAVLEIREDMRKFKEYSQEVQQRAIQIQYSYIDPPPYIANHPVLMEMWDQFMQKYTNPISIQDFPEYLPDLPHNDDGRAFMEEKIRKDIQKYDEQFVRLWHEDKSLLMAKKKQTQIQFYNISTKILEQYQALEDKSKPEEDFLKLPKKPKRKQEKFVRINMDQLTKMLYLNSKNKSQYNLDFFAKYFGMEQPEQRQALFEALNSLSYLRVFAPDQSQPNALKQVRQQVLKFID